MSALHAKKIVLGISGSIAAYKTPLLVRALIKAGAKVKVVMTPAAKSFVAPLTLSTVSNNPVYSEFVDNEEEVWNNHVDLGLWADLMLIAPASANTMSKMAHANCDNLLLAVYLSAKCPVYFAPAMDLDMHAHPATQHAIDLLISRKNIHIPAAEGALASGLEGVGRMQEPDDIVAFIEEDLASSLPWIGTKMLITAGPTYEPIDPVRFIGNHSSGKMGFAIATVAADLGAEVFLISGPSQLQIKHSLVHRINVVSAAEMYQVVHKYFSEVDIAILSAAVADYTPKKTATQKIKKTALALEIELSPTKDILASLGAIKQHQYLVGFALETNNELENAKSKLQRKNLDAIVLNSLQDEGAGFATDTNKITFIDNAMNEQSFELKSKVEVAKDIMNEIIKKTNA
jgi:phosphopantothenoylcysteine decarboxylase/phosphopantothenate--cysteine ligase